MMFLDEKISQAKAKLLVEYPYFGSVASKLELILNNDIESFKSDGSKLEYNSDFFNEIELSEMEFVLANGAMHASLLHDNRKNNRSGWLWQLATDYAINDMLVENGLDRPYQAHYSQRFSGLYAEEIYAELKDDILRDELEYEADDLEDVQNNESEQTQQRDNEKIFHDETLQEQLFEEFAKSVLEAELQKDELPQSIERFFEIDIKGQIDWRDELKVAIERFHKDDYTLLPPSKKFLYMGLYLPSCVSETFRLVIAIDSSGSIDDALLRSFLSEIDFLMLSVQNYEIDLLVCDEKIHTHKVFYKGENLESFFDQAQIKGGAGTDFRVVFEFVNTRLSDTKLLLYFTDLEGIFPQDVPNYSVKWLSEKEGVIPFGELLVLQEN